MKNIIAIVTLMLTASPLCAQSFESMKAQDLNTVSLQAASEVVLPKVEFTPVPAETKAAGVWKHVALYAADGTAIAVDYTVPAGAVHVADTVWINVTNKAFSGANRILVTLKNYQDKGVSPGMLQATQQISLAYAGGSRYTGKAPNTVLLYTGNASGGGNYVESYRQEIEVTVDGKKLTATQGNSSSFMFAMDGTFTVQKGINKSGDEAFVLLRDEVSRLSALLNATPINNPNYKTIKEQYIKASDKLEEVTEKAIDEAYALR